MLTVARYELVDLEWHERGKSVEYDDQHSDHERDVRSPRQQRVAVRHDAPRDPLGFHPLQHVVVADEDRDPVQGAEHSDQGDEVSKDRGGILGHVHEAQCDEQRRDGHRGDGDTALVGLVEDGRGLAVLGQGPDGPRGEVDVRVSGGDGEDEQEGVDDAVQLANTRDLGRDDEGGRGAARSLGRVADEPRVVIRDRHAQADDAGDVEEDDTQQCLPHSAGHVLARVGSLAECDTDQLGTEVGEGGLHDGGPHTKEAAQVSFNIVVLLECTWVLPVSETSSVVVWAAPKSNDEADQDQRADDDGLQKRHPELCLTKEADMEELQVWSALRSVDSESLVEGESVR